MKPLPAALVTGPPLLAAIAAWSPLWLAADPGAVRDAYAVALDASGHVIAYGGRP